MRLVLELKTAFEQLQVQPGLEAFVESLKVRPKCTLTMFESAAGHIPTDLPSEPCALASLSTVNKAMPCHLYSKS